MVKGKAFKTDAGWLEVVSSSRPLGTPHDEYDRMGYNAAINYWRGKECKQRDFSMPEVLVDGTGHVLEVIEEEDI